MLSSIAWFVAGLALGYWVLHPIIKVIQEIRNRLYQRKLKKHWGSLLLKADEFSEGYIKKGVTPEYVDELYKAAKARAYDA